jgi:hypothetical protein
MNVALVTEFSASRKEPLAAVLERVHGAFLSSGLGEPDVQFVFADAPVAGFTSSVERVLKRQPQLAGFVSNAPGMPGGPPVRMISNGSTSPANRTQVPFATILAVAAGVPRSFPLHNVVVHFQSPAFGTTTGVSHPLFAMPPGVVVSDSWWVSGRNRSVRAVTCVNADAASHQLPPPSSEVALVLEACGKPRKTVQIPLGEAPAAENPRPAQAPPETLKAVGELVLDYRARLAEIVDRANLPHDLPPALEAMQVVALGDVTGPKKPVLVHAFKPMGYGCRGESGTFTLRRRTAGHLTVEVFLDVGTWSRSVTAFLTVTGLGFGARLPLPVAKRAIGAGQYSIGNAQRWQKIVDNLAALVAELDKTFVPAIEAISGPVPEWYKPET